MGGGNLHPPRAWETLVTPWGSPLRELPPHPIPAPASPQAPTPPARHLPQHKCSQGDCLVFHTRWLSFIKSNNRINRWDPTAHSKEPQTNCLMRKQSNSDRAVQIPHRTPALQSSDVLLRACLHPAGTCPPRGAAACQQVDVTHSWRPGIL